MYYRGALAETGRRSNQITVPCYFKFRSVNTIRLNLWRIWQLINVNGEIHIELIDVPLLGQVRSHVYCCIECSFVLIWNHRNTTVPQGCSEFADDWTSKSEELHYKLLSGLNCEKKNMDKKLSIFSNSFGNYFHSIKYFRAKLWKRGEKVCIF